MMDRGQESHGTRRYGQWAGKPDGYPENIEHCIKGVFPGNSFIERQCTRKRGYGLNKLYCKQHAKLGNS